MLRNMKYIKTMTFGIHCMIASNSKVLHLNSSWNTAFGLKHFIDVPRTTFIMVSLGSSGSFVPKPSCPHPPGRLPTLPHLKGGVAVVHGVLDQQVLQNADSQLPHIRTLLQGFCHLSQQQTHQEVIATVFLSQAELQALFCCQARWEVLRQYCVGSDDVKMHKNGVRKADKH